MTIQIKTPEDNVFQVIKDGIEIGIIIYNDGVKFKQTKLDVELDRYELMEITGFLRIF